MYLRMLPDPNVYQQYFLLIRIFAENNYSMVNYEIIGEKPPFSGLSADYSAPESIGALIPQVFILLNGSYPYIRLFPGINGIFDLHKVRIISASDLIQKPTPELFVNILIMLRISDI